MSRQVSFFMHRALVAASVSVLCSAVVLGQQALAQATPPPVPSEELPAGSQVLASGPVHEAFATPVTMDAQAPVVVSSQPPASLQETPPAERPEGAGIVWVPGYWAWDADRNDYIWVSGCWRNPPPNTYWVPGYWLHVGTGWQWVSGFWAPITTQAQQTIEYLPMPPAMTGVESVGTPPQPDQIWVSGCWYWMQDRYVWRRGYWMTQQAGWVWMPAHYVWTPRGYIFCQGSWDYALDNRGVLFTPTYFPPPFACGPDLCFVPACAWTWACCGSTCSRIPGTTTTISATTTMTPIAPSAFIRGSSVKSCTRGTIRFSFMTAGTTGSRSRVGPRTARMNLRCAATTAICALRGRSPMCRRGLRIRETSMPSVLWSSR